MKAVKTFEILAEEFEHLKKKAIYADMLRNMVSLTRGDNDDPAAIHTIFVWCRENATDLWHYNFRGIHADSNAGFMLFAAEQDKENFLTWFTVAKLAGDFDIKREN